MLSGSVEATIAIVFVFRGVAGFVNAAGYDQLSSKMEPVYGAVANDEQYVPSAFVGAVRSLSTA